VIRVGLLGHRTRTLYADPVVLFYEILLGAVAVAVIWFAIYVVYRLLHEDK
jgi:hypothetical protein